MPISFQQPLFLLALVLIPALWYLFLRSDFRHNSRPAKAGIAGLRTLVFLLVILALADPRFAVISDRVNVFFCLDSSDSIRAEQHRTALDFIKRAGTGMKDEDLAGLIVFGREPSLETDLTDQFDIVDIRSLVNKNFTNISGALQLAIGRMPRQGLNRIVLLTDGNQNIGDSVHMAHLAGSLGVEIHPLPLESWFQRNEVFLQELISPPRTPVGTPFNVQAVIRSARTGPAGLVIFKNGRLLAETGVELKIGKNVHNFKDIIEEEGLSLYKAVINAPDDEVFQNNEGLSFTRGEKKAGTLYVAELGRGEPYPARVLKAQGLNVRIKTPADFPGSLQELLDFEAIVLDNVPSHSLPLSAMENMEKYVRDTGGGLVMLGGDRSFGAGEYLGTPVERTLPVFMDVPSSLDLAGFALALVIDKSASMAGALGGENKMEGAKIAAFATVELLNPKDRVGLLAFDTAFNWIVPLTEAGKRDEIAGRLSALKEGGGTELFPALREAYKVLKETESARKHVIVLSDGLTGQADFQPLVKSMAGDRISVSTVALGADADLNLLKQIAEWGGGRTYYTSEVSAVPNIFTTETRLASKGVILEKNLRPEPAAASEIIAGLNPAAFPPVLGMVVTYPKPGAMKVLNTPEGPLLTAWPYGLGRSAAFTSDLSGRWGREWIQWNGFGQFMAQMVKWAQRKESQGRYESSISRQGGAGDFLVEVTDDQERFVNNLDLKIKLLPPSGAGQTISLTQIAPGRYQAAFPAEEIGPYYLSLYGTSRKGLTAAETYGFAVPHSDEFSNTGINYDLLNRLARITGGKTLSLTDAPPSLFTSRPGLVRPGDPTWPFLLLFALLLLPLDVLIRKIIRPGRPITKEGL